MFTEVMRCGQPLRVVGQDVGGTAVVDARPGVAFVVTRPIPLSFTWKKKLNTSTGLVPCLGVSVVNFFQQPFAGFDVPFYTTFLPGPSILFFVVLSSLFILKRCFRLRT